MHMPSALLTLAAIGALAACTGEEVCTSELARQKAADLAARMQVVAAADPGRLVDLAPRVQELAAKASAQGDDLQAACRAMDELLAELSR
jgi:hypothetical protein